MNHVEMKLSDRDATSTILVVDDTPENLRLLVRALSGAGHRVRAAPSGEIALRMARSERPDLVLLDIDMPDLDGFQVCELMRADPALRPVPVLFISAIHDSRAKVKALRAGGRDYVTKPFNMEEVLARVAMQLELRQLELALKDMNLRLAEIVESQVREISDAQLATIVALAKLAESRDDTTGMHVVRMAEISRVVAESYVRQSDGSTALDAERVRVLGRAATLHDIGKVGIPDAVLLKPGRLTAEELEIMKTHSEIGAKTLEAVIRSYPRNELLRVGAEIARSHHERWDGAGYPAGLAGEAIPLSARIVSVADVYDAVRAVRPYKPPQTHEATAAAIRQGRGTQFDPAVVDAFFGVEGEIETVWRAMQSAREVELARG